MRPCMKLNHPPAAKSHTQRDKWLTVRIYQPFGERVFIVHQTPAARIASKDLLTIIPRNYTMQAREQGLLELPFHTYLEFMDLSTRNQLKMDCLWGQWKAKVRVL